FAFQIRKETINDGFRSQPKRGCYFLKDRLTVEASADFVRPGCLALPSGTGEYQLPQLLGRMAGDDFKVAAILEEFGQPLMDELSRIVAKRLAHLLFNLAARATHLAAKYFQQALGDFEPRGTRRVEIIGDDALA